MMKSETASADVTALLLAGGQSTRFGEANKLLAPYDGRPLIAHVFTAVSHVTDTRVVIAIQASEQRRALSEAVSQPDIVRFVADDQALEGPIAAIYGGLKAIETQWALVCAGDMLLVSAEALRWLSAQHLSRHVDAVVSVNDGRIVEPLQALYRRDAVERTVETLARSVGVRSLLSSLNDVLEVRVANNPSEADASLTDINTQKQPAMLKDSREAAGGE